MMPPVLCILVGLVLGAALMRWLGWDAIERELLARDLEHRRELESLAAESAGFFRDGVAVLPGEHLPYDPAERPTPNAQRPTSNVQRPTPNSPKALEALNTLNTLEALILASQLIPLSCPLAPPIVVACGAEDRAKLERFWKIVRNLEAFREDAE